MDEEAFLDLHRRGPRITSLASVFDAMVEGRAGVPVRDPFAPGPGSPDALLTDADQRLILAHYTSFVSDFVRHGNASVPFLTEMFCRLIDGVLRYARACDRGVEGEGATGNRFLLQEIAGADGAFSRTLASLADGRISTLTNSPTLGNYQEFLRNHPPASHFWHGPFFEITRNSLAGRNDLAHFQDGFDLILEVLGFQMYSCERADQIAFVARNLKAGGILALLEKCNQDDPVEYAARERQKDEDFKAHYFTAADIQDKKTSVLRDMEKGQVTLGALTAAVGSTFAHAALVWNSGNFHLVLASNHRRNLERFVAGLTPPVVPDAFCYETTPRTLLPERALSLRYRPIRTAAS